MSTEEEEGDEEPEAEDDTDDPVKAKKIRKKLSMSDKRGKGGGSAVCTAKPRLLASSGSLARTKFTDILVYMSS